MNSLVFLPRAALAATLPFFLLACTSGLSESEAESSIPCPECDKPDASPPPHIDAAPPPQVDAGTPPDIDAAPPDETGCTRTQGYWKRHNEHATPPGLQLDWPAPPPHVWNARPSPSTTEPFAVPLPCACHLAFQSISFAASSISAL